MIFTVTFYTFYTYETYETYMTTIISMQYVNIKYDEVTMTAVVFITNSKGTIIIVVKVHNRITIQCSAVLNHVLAVPATTPG